MQLLVAKSDIATTLVAMESQPPVLDPQGNSALEFSVDSKRLLDVLSEAGNVADDYTCASTTSAFGVGIETASPGQDASFIITARDFHGTERTVGGDLFEVELRGKKGTKVEVKLVDRRDGTYTGTYTLPVDSKGELQLSILFPRNSYPRESVSCSYHCIAVYWFCTVVSEPAALPGAVETDGPGVCCSPWSPSWQPCGNMARVCGG